MIAPIQFIWKQLNGPQISAVAQGIYGYLKSWLDPYLEYFRNWSISTLNDGHLTLAGLLSNFARPIIRTHDIKMFWFTDGPQIDEAHGFTEELRHGEDVLGGKFTDLRNDSDNTHNEYLDASAYRSLLQCILTSKGEAGSLVLLDDFLALITPLYRWDHTAQYVLDWDTARHLSQGIYSGSGDIVAYVGNVTEWGDNIGAAQACLSSLVTAWYAPQPQLFISFSESPIWLPIFEIVPPDAEHRWARLRPQKPLPPNVTKISGWMIIAYWMLLNNDWPYSYPSTNTCGPAQSATFTQAAQEIELRYNGPSPFVWYAYNSWTGTPNPMVYYDDGTSASLAELGAVQVVDYDYTTPLYGLTGVGNLVSLNIACKIYTSSDGKVLNIQPILHPVYDTQMQAPWCGMLLDVTLAGTTSSAVPLNYTLVLDLYRDRYGSGALLTEGRVVGNIQPTEDIYVDSTTNKLWGDFVIKSRVYAYRQDQRQPENILFDWHFADITATELG